MNPNQNSIDKEIVADLVLILDNLELFELRRSKQIKQILLLAMADVIDNMRDGEEEDENNFFE